MPTRTSHYSDRAARYKAKHQHQEHELDLWIALFPPGYDGTSNEEPTPLLTKIDPTPKIVSRPIDVASITEGRGAEIVRLAKYEVSELSREYTEAEIKGAYYFVVPRGTAVTPTDAKRTDADKVFPRFRILGNPNMFEKQWRMTLVEAKA